MKKNTRSATAVVISVSLLASNAFALDVVTGYGAAGASNPALAAFPLAPSTTESQVGGTSTPATSTTAGFTATQIGVAAVIVAGAATAIAVGASGGGSSNSSSSTHSH